MDGDLHVAPGVQPAVELLRERARAELAQPVELEAVAHPEFPELAQAVEVDRIGRTMRLGGHLHDSRHVCRVSRHVCRLAAGPDDPVPKPAVDHDPVGEEVDREHQFVPLRGTSPGSRDQAGVQHGDVQPAPALRKFVAEPVHAVEIGEIHLEHLHVGRTRGPPHRLAGLGMAAAASHQDAASPGGQIDGDGLAQPAVGARDQTRPAVDANIRRRRLDRIPGGELVVDRRAESLRDGAVARHPASAPADSDGMPNAARYEAKQRSMHRPETAKVPAS